MFMSVNKRSHVSCTNDVEMWILEEKKRFTLVNRVIESYSKPLKAK